MSRILLADDMAICREPIAAALRSDGYDVICACSGEEALRLLREQKPDVLLLDVSMPGVDGLAVLRTVRGDPGWQSIPIIMLTDRNDRDCVTRAAGYKIEGYVLKSNFSLSDLVARIERSLRSSPAPGVSANGDAEGKHPLAARALSLGGAQAAATSELQPVMTRDEVIKLITQDLELRPLSAAVQNVVTASMVPGCSADDVAKAVSQDHALSIRLLKLANSSAYSRGRPAGSVKEAVQRIGITQVGQMAMALGVVQRYEHTNMPSLDPRLFWEHATACGLLAAAIAKARGAKNSNEYFLWGTLHDVGRLLLVENASEAANKVFEAAEQWDLPLEVAEAKLLTLDHCDVLARALEHWQFPADFIAPVISHHRPLAVIKRLGSNSEPAAVIALADRVAHALALGSSGNNVLEPVDELCEFLSVSPQALCDIAGSVVNETRDLKFSMLARANETGWPDFVEEIRKRIVHPLRPLYLNTADDIDAVRLFLGRVITTPGTDAPNFAVVRLRSASELASAVARLGDQEQELGIEELPLVIVTECPLELDGSLLASRRILTAGLPVGVVPLVRLLQDLVASNSG